MAEYQPPIPNPPNIPFNPSEFLYPSSQGEGLSQAQADARYLIKINPDSASALETFTSGIETTTVEDVTSGSGILSIDSSNTLNIGGTTCSTLNIGNPLSNTTIFGNTTLQNFLSYNNNLLPTPTDTTYNNIPMFFEMIQSRTNVISQIASSRNLFTINHSSSSTVLEALFINFQGIIGISTNSNITIKTISLNFNLVKGNGNTTYTMTSYDGTSSVSGSDTSDVSLTTTTFDSTTSPGVFTMRFTQTRTGSLFFTSYLRGKWKVYNPNSTNISITFI
jgi:hypothetical protein